MTKLGAILSRVIAAFDKRLRGATGKHFKRFVLAAVVAVTASQLTLTLCLGVFRMPAERAGFIAWFVGAAASYVMSRWAWERKGTPHLLKETLPFWLIAIGVAAILTLTTKFASELAVSMGLSHTQRVLFVDAAFFLANCITFLVRFFIFHYILFADKGQKHTLGTSPAYSNDALVIKRSQKVFDDIKIAFSKGRTARTQFAKRHPRLVGTGTFIAPLILYILISCIYLRPNFTVLHTTILNSSPDPEQFVWFLNWWPYALTHHLNPFITKFVWYPHGYNLAWATSVPALALLMAPVTLTGGAILSFNLIALLAPPLSALACFYLVYSITKRFLPALIGGYLYGFSTFEMAQLGGGHPQVYVNFLVPLIVLLCWRRLSDKINTRPFVILTGILLALQFGISNEIFATFIIFLTLAVIVFYLFSGQELKSKSVALVVRFYGATVLSLVLVSPYLYYILKGYKDIPRTLRLLTTFSSDALNYIVPTPITQLGGHSALRLSGRFTGNFSEDGAYIGLPLLVILVYVTWRYRRKAYMLAMSTLLALIMFCSLGPKLHIAGHTGHIGHTIGIPLPWIIPEHLPFIKSAQPDRFTMYMSLVIAVIIGIWLSIKTTRRNQIMKYAAVLVGIAFIVPTASQYAWVRVPVPTIFNKAQVSRYIPKGGNLILLPYGVLGSDMYYQYKSGMRFTQSGGYVGAAPKEYANNPVLLSFLMNPIKPDFEKGFARFCIANKVTEIIYLPQTSPTVVNAISGLGWPTQKIYEATVVKVPSDQMGTSTEN